MKYLPLAVFTLFLFTGVYVELDARWACALAAVVVAVNFFAYGHLVVGSSEDSVWPLLAGSDLKTRGRWSPENYTRYRAEFKKISGRDDFSLYRDTAVVAPLIRREIHQRWREHFLEECCLSLEKYRRLWSSGGEWAVGNRSPDRQFTQDYAQWYRDFL